MSLTNRANAAVNFSEHLILKLCSHSEKQFSSSLSKTTVSLWKSSSSSAVWACWHDSVIMAQFKKTFLNDINKLLLSWFILPWTLYYLNVGVWQTLLLLLGSIWSGFALQYWLILNRRFTNVLGNIPLAPYTHAVLEWFALRGTNELVCVNSEASKNLLRQTEKFVSKLNWKEIFRKHCTLYSWIK